MKMEITVNGKKRQTAASTLAGLLSELGVEKRFCVIELDGRIIKEDPGKESLEEGSVIEIMRFVGGG